MDELLHRERAIDLMRRHNIDVLLATTPENVTYLTGHIGRRQYSCVSPLSFGVFTLSDGAIDLVVGGTDLSYYASRPGFANVVRGYGALPGLAVEPGYTPVGEEARRFFEFLGSERRSPTAMDARAAAARERGLVGARLAVDQPAGSPLLGLLSEQCGGSTILPAINLFRMIRLVKTSAELECMRRAAELNEHAIACLSDELHQGTRELDLAALWRARVAGAGALPAWFYFGAGERSAWFVPPTNRRLEPGDMFVYDCGLVLDGYNADTGCCGSVGRPSRTDQRRFDAIFAALEDAIGLVREGAIGSEIYETLVATARRCGFPEFDSSFAGHTLGLEARDLPFVLAPRVDLHDIFLPDTSDMPLPAGTVLNVEAPMGLLGHCGYHIERTILVTSDGHLDLIAQPRRLLQVE